MQTCPCPAREIQKAVKLRKAERDDLRLKTISSDSSRDKSSCCLLLSNSEMFQ